MFVRWFLMADKKVVEGEGKKYESIRPFSALEVLRELGLTENEAKTFQVMCALGPASASEIAEKVGMHRALAYNTLARLLEKGFASQTVQDKKKVFRAVTPAHLWSLYEEREKRLSAGVESLAKNLEQVYRVSEKPSVAVFTGLDGLKAVLSEELTSQKKGGEILYYLALPALASAMPVFVAWYHKTRGSKGIQARAIFDSSPVSFERAKEFARLPLAEVRILREEFSSPITYHVFGDQIAILSIAGKESIGILVKSKEISSFFKKSFDFTWRKLKTVEELSKS